MDRITRLRIQNVRAFEDVTIDLSAGVTVLIGENGAGKSTIIECLELLQRVPEQRFMGSSTTSTGGCRACCGAGPRNSP